MVMHARKYPRLDDGYYERNKERSLDNHEKHYSAVDHRTDLSKSSYNEKSCEISSRGLSCSPPREKSKKERLDASRHELSLSDRTENRGGVKGKEKDHRSEVQKSAIRIHGDWSEHLSSSGKRYFYNCLSEVSQWEKPSGWPDTPNPKSSHNRSKSKDRSSVYHSNANDSRSKHSSSRDNSSGRSTSYNDHSSRLNGPSDRSYSDRRPAQVNSVNVSKRDGLTRPDSLIDARNELVERHPHRDSREKHSESPYHRSKSASQRTTNSLAHRAETSLRANGGLVRLNDSSSHCDFDDHGVSAGHPPRDEDMDISPDVTPTTSEPPSRSLFRKNTVRLRSDSSIASANHINSSNSEPPNSDFPSSRSDPHRYGSSKVDSIHSGVNYTDSLRCDGSKLNRSATMGGALPINSQSGQTELDSQNITKQERYFRSYPVPPRTYQSAWHAGRYRPYKTSPHNRKQTYAIETLQKLQQALLARQVQQRNQQQHVNPSASTSSSTQAHYALSKSPKSSLTPGVSVSSSPYQPAASPHVSASYSYTAVNHSSSHHPASVSQPIASSLSLSNSCVGSTAPPLNASFSAPSSSYVNAQPLAEEPGGPHRDSYGGATPEQATISDFERRHCNQSPKGASPAHSQSSSQDIPISRVSSLSGAAPVGISAASSAATAAKKPNSLQLTPSLANYFESKLIQHVAGWQHESLEKQADQINEEANMMGNQHCAQVSVELKCARSLVRIAEIQSTTHEQRTLFLHQQIKDLENMRTSSTYISSQNNTGAA